MDASLAALLGALIGSLPALVGQFHTMLTANRNERRKLALETGYREWEQMLGHFKGTGADIFPPALFVHYNLQLLRLLDKRGGLTAERYRALIQRHEEVRAVMKEDNDLRVAQRGQS